MKLLQIKERMVPALQLYHIYAVDHHKETKSCKPRIQTQKN